MITNETIAAAATRHQTTKHNIAREYVQHLFLRAFYNLGGETERILFKGGTALRIAYDSPRFSEDLDFSSFGLDRSHLETLFLTTLDELQTTGLRVEIDDSSHPTSGGYFGVAKCSLLDYEIGLEINVNARPASEVRGEYRLINPGFAPNYGLLLLPQATLVEEKLSALVSRQKPRDFYDLYFILRSGLLSVEARQRLVQVIPVVEQTKIDFGGELRTFLPVSSQAIIRDFKQTLLTEIRRNAGV